MTPDGDRGVGLLSSVLGLAVLLSFLFLAAHILLGLYVSSMLGAEAGDAARHVASSAVDHHDPDAVRRAEREAAVTLRRRLGRFADRVRPLDWSGTDGRHIRVRVVARLPRSPWLDRVVGPAIVTRDARQRVEEFER